MSSSVVISDEFLKFLLLDLRIALDNPMFDQPGLGLGFRPLRVGSILSTIVVVVHQTGEFVALLLVVGSDEAAVMEPVPLMSRVR